MKESACPVSQVRRTRQTSIHLVAIIVVAAVFFASGYFTSLLLSETRVRAQSLEGIKEFIAVGTQLGVVNVDWQKLRELECIASEAEWEDRDAETNSPDELTCEGCGGHNARP